MNKWLLIGCENSQTVLLWKSIKHSDAIKHDRKEGENHEGQTDAS
jgi:hypothetical protein